MRAPGSYLCFNSDSFKILIDNCASTSITNSMDDFVSKPRAATKSIQGISGDTEAPLIGTVAWKIEDDNGRVHTITLPNTYYAPNAPYRLLSPQHWSQTARDTTPHLHGTWCVTYDDSLVLWWWQQKYKHTVALHHSMNVAMFYSAPGNKNLPTAVVCLKT